MIEQFSVCTYGSTLVVILTNTVFNQVESILVAPIKENNKRLLIKGLQIECDVDSKNMFIDLLDIATVSKRRLKLLNNLSLSNKRHDIKSGIDLLIDGF